MNNDMRKVLIEKLGEEYFALSNDNEIPALAQNKPRFITIYVLRETIAPLINRSDDPESTVSQIIKGPKYGQKEIVEIPARKFKSKEKLMGLKLCRAFGLVDAHYEYNSVSKKEFLDNPNSVIFGDSVVEGGEAGQAMLPSKVFYSSSYSIRNKETITKKLTHNALSESGTMWDRRKTELRSSLFNTEYICPGSFFPSFITLYNPTPESLIHILLCLKERTYGAQTSITGPNVKNNIVAIYSGKSELPITSFTITNIFGETILDSLDEGYAESSKIKNKLNEVVLEAIMKCKPSHVIHGEEMETTLDKIFNSEQSDLESVYQKLKEDTHELIKFSGILEQQKKVKGKKPRKEEAEEPLSEEGEE